MTLRRTALLMAIAVAAVALAACSSTTDESTTTAAGGSTTTAGGGGAEVTIANSAFDPSELVVTVGTTVTWTNSDGATHTVTADGGAFDSGSLTGGATFQFTFNQVGEFPYHCSIHTTMHGTISVKGSA